MDPNLKPAQPNEPPTCRVVSAHQSAYPDPLIITQGEALTIGEKESEWGGWLWCTNQQGKSGWVPEKYLRRTGDTGNALRHYNATELSVEVGEELIMGKEESGWIWCTNRQGQSGWVPAANVEFAREESR
jgi:uncharacterized protein YgiM (DUF1202 family)